MSNVMIFTRQILHACTYSYTYFAPERRGGGGGGGGGVSRTYVTINDRRIKRMNADY